MFLRFAAYSALFLTLNFSGLSQCAYEVNEKDAISGMTVFKTKSHDISGKIEKKKSYIAKGVKASFEKDSEHSMLTIEFKITNSFKKSITYMQGRDQLIIRFSDNSVDSLPMIKAPSLFSNQYGVRGTLKYEINESLKQKFILGTPIAAMRITGIKFDMDITDFKTDLVEVFNSCWIE